MKKEPNEVEEEDSLEKNVMDIDEIRNRKSKKTFQ